MAARTLLISLAGRRGRSIRSMFGGAQANHHFCVSSSGSAAGENNDGSAIKFLSDKICRP